MQKGENVFNRIILFVGLVLTTAGNAYAYCFNDEFLTTPDPALREAEYRPHRPPENWKPSRLATSNSKSYEGLTGT